jgi:ankyrin repeat protein
VRPLAEVEALLAAGSAAEPPEECLRGARSPLEIAAERGHPDIVALLLARGAAVRRAPMWAVGQHDRVEVLELIFDAMPEAERQRQLDETLAYAGQDGRVESARWLLARGADPNGPAPPAYGPALTVAARSGHAELVRLLLAAGADPDAPAAIESAASAGDPAAVRALLEAGADPHRADAQGNALSVAAAATEGPRHADYDAVAAILLEAGVDPNVHHRGMLPRSWAEECGNQALADRLAEAGGRRGSTAAHKLERVAGQLRALGYAALLLLGGGH